MNTLERERVGRVGEREREREEGEKQRDSTSMILQIFITQLGIK